MERSFQLFSEMGFPVEKLSLFLISILNTRMKREVEKVIPSPPVPAYQLYGY